MPMSKKHYEAFASAISDVMWEEHSDPVTVARIVAALAQVCERDNPRFDKIRFVTACTEKPSTR